MAQYTMELRKMIQLGYPIGLKDYPIFDENYRKQLNDKIITHYAFREIGQETPNMFIIFLNRKMAEIMPYYNQLYLSEKLEFDPLSNYKNTEKFVKEAKAEATGVDTGNTSQVGVTSNNSESDDTSHSQNDSTTTSQNSSNNTTDANTNNTTTNNSKKISSDTPQGFLNADNIEDVNYATSAEVSTDKTTSIGQTHSDNDTTSNGVDHTKGTIDNQANHTDSFTGKNEVDFSRQLMSQNNVENTENYIKEISGYMGVSPSKLLQEYRNTFMNIDMMIIHDLNELFLFLYN